MINFNRNVQFAFDLKQLCGNECALEMIKESLMKESLGRKKHSSRNYENATQSFISLLVLTSISPNKVVSQGNCLSKQSRILEYPASY